MSKKSSSQKKKINWTNIPTDNQRRIRKAKLWPAARKVRTRKALGLDGIPSEILKEVVKHNSSWTLNTPNDAYVHGKFQDAWTVEDLLLIPKQYKTSHKLTNKYRPLCMLNAVDKLFEADICRRIMIHLEPHDLLSNKQFS